MSSDQLLSGTHPCVGPVRPGGQTIPRAGLLILRVVLPCLVLTCMVMGTAFAEPTDGAPILDPTTIPQYVDPLVIPPAMPLTEDVNVRGRSVDYYEIAVRQFEQQILPAADENDGLTGFGATTVWSYGSVNHPGTVAEDGTFNYPAFTIEARVNRPVRVKWINDLVDAEGDYLPHLLPVDQTLHWANPPGGIAGRDTRPTFMGTPGPYTGPVPIITHVHGAHAEQESDGYPEAWYLPAANDIPAGYATTGTYYDIFEQSSWLGGLWEPGAAVFQYRNDQPATTLWYHDHTLGMTRLNVYAGPAGFYLLRGGPSDHVRSLMGGQPADNVLPGPAPQIGNPEDTSYYEIPIVIQDRTFREDGSLFYPEDRAFFEGLDPSQLQIPFIGEDACGDGPSDVPPIWNPEFFGNTIVVNGKTWPFLEVEPRRYRFRFLNGSDSRFVILKIVTDPLATRPTTPTLQFWQIGADGGFLPSPVQLPHLLMGPAERADVIVDFTSLAEGTELYLINEGPDDPFGGGAVGTDFQASDPQTTGQVMKFQVGELQSVDTSAHPALLVLPNLHRLGPAYNVRQVSLNEEESLTVLVSEVNSDIVLDCDFGAPFGPTAALLGTLNTDGTANPLRWSDAITETPLMGRTEVWEIYNFTADAHPIHIHLVQFETLNRQALATDGDGVAISPAVLVGDPIPPESWETGLKDTVIVYPGQLTRVKAVFDIPGLFVWHCHILEHEDNEMMRPYYVKRGPMDMPPAPTMPMP